MSRIGRKPITIPSGVDVKVGGQVVAVKGPMGQLEWKLAQGVSVVVENGHLIVNRKGDTSNLRAIHGLTRAELFNQIEGVQKGYERTLELTGVGYRAQVQGQTLTFSVGFSHPVSLELPAGVKATVDKQTVVSIPLIETTVCLSTVALTNKR